MSKNTNTRTIEPGKIYTRDEVLQETSALIRHLKNKATSGRFRDHDNEKLRDAKMRLQTELMKLHAAVLKDSELDDLKKRIENLEMKKK